MITTRTTGIISIIIAIRIIEENYVSPSSFHYDYYLYFITTSIKMYSESYNNNNNDERKDTFSFSQIKDALNKSTEARP